MFATRILLLEEESSTAAAASRPMPSFLACSPEGERERLQQKSNPFRVVKERRHFVSPFLICYSSLFPSLPSPELVQRSHSTVPSDKDTREQGAGHQTALCDPGQTYLIGCEQY